MQAVSPVLPGSESLEYELGKDQPQYTSLPCFVLTGVSVPVLTRWRLTHEERAAIANGADLVLTQLTFNRGFQPVNLQVTMPDTMPVLLCPE